MPKEGVSLIGHDDILRYEEILRVVNAAIDLGLVKVRVTGGEPLIRRGVLEFLRKLTAFSQIQEVTLTTNGILLEETAEELWNTGIKRLNVSLDSLDSDKYAQITGGGGLQKVIRGIRKAQRVGFEPIKINVVVIKDINDNEILDFADLTLKEPYQVRFIELMSLGYTASGESAYVSNENVMQKIKSKYGLVPMESRGASDGPADVYRIKGATGEIGFISSGDTHLCTTCNRIRLTADGYLRACLLSDQETDIRSVLRSGCSDSELKRIISMAIKNKSRDRASAHERNIKKCVKPMNAIGG
jgi:cyclic pyranopterin phosphate synthase